MIRLIKDQGGASAVEFALIAPVLIAMYFGIAELSQGMMSGNKAGEVASSIGDLASQNTCLTNAQVTDVFTIGGLLIKPF
ncbi:MAG: pilus assembly protein TadE, partial [Caulobacteraceae bacterium]|nr:pilus assembly protein TadE [Caulobacteraceae bacterium]